MDVVSQLTLDALQENLGGTKEAPIESKKLTINGLPALQTIVKGSSDNINVVFIHTSIETKDSFCQVLAWTLSSRWDSNRGELEQVVNSFREATPASKSP